MDLFVICFCFNVEFTHCTCMADVSEVCSYLVLLCAVQFKNITRSTTSCTDVRSLWNIPNISKVQCIALENMNFGRIFTYSKIPAEDVPSLSTEEIVDILRKLKEASDCSLLMQVMEPFATDLQVLRLNIFKQLHKRRV